MLREMPCGKERVVHYKDEFQAEAAPVLTHRLKEGNWFGFAEVDIEIPEPCAQSLRRCVLSFTTKRSLSKLYRNVCSIT